MVHVKRHTRKKSKGSGQKVSKSRELSEQRKKELEKYAVDTVASNYVRYQEYAMDDAEEEGEDYEEDIYNDFNDELYDDMKAEKEFSKADIDYVMKFIDTDAFWKRLYKENKHIKSGMIQF